MSKGNGMRTVMRSIKIIGCKIFEKSWSSLHADLRTRYNGVYF